MSYDNALGKGSMVETATFSMFHRAPPMEGPPQPEPQARPAMAPAAAGMLDIRARRRAVRKVTRPPAAWPESDQAASPWPAPAAHGALPAMPHGALPAMPHGAAGMPRDGFPSAPPAAFAGMPHDAWPPAPPRDAWPGTEPAWAPVAEPVRRRPAPRPHWYRSEKLALDHQLIGLASPLACTVTGALAGAPPVRLSTGRTGLYRPDGFRPAPWSGFAYDASPDCRNGLAAGTRILTVRGEVPVEQLVPGDVALALRGPALLPIVWIGRSIAAAPAVQVEAGAFGPHRPRATLRVGPDQPLFIEAEPVAARALVNGATIRVAATGGMELFHVDVGVAEVLLAEGVPLASARQ